jgi:hypothetical protein
VQRLARERCSQAHGFGQCWSDKRENARGLSFNESGCCSGDGSANGWMRREGGS